MANQPNPAGEPSSGPGSKIPDVGERAGQLEEGQAQKEQEYGRRAAEKIDAQRRKVVSSLGGAAATLHKKAETLPGGEKVKSIAHGAADRIQATANYVDEFNSRAVLDDVETFVRRHPGQSLAAAAVVGFLVGRFFRSIGD